MKQLHAILLRWRGIDIKSRRERKVRKDFINPLRPLRTPRETTWGKGLPSGMRRGVAILVFTLLISGLTGFGLFAQSHPNLIMTAEGVSQIRAGAEAPLFEQAVQQASRRLQLLFRKA